MFLLRNRRPPASASGWTSCSPPHPFDQQDADYELDGTLDQIESHAPYGEEEADEE